MCSIKSDQTMFNMYCNLISAATSTGAVDNTVRAAGTQSGGNAAVTNPLGMSVLS